MADQRIEKDLFPGDNAKSKKTAVDDVDLDDDEDDTDGKKKKKKYWFPNWVNYITWTLVVISCTISASFVVFYSLEWGKIKSEEWLSSLLLSICQSIVIIQPIKVVVLAILLSCILKKVDEEDDENPDNAIAQTDEELEDPVLANDKFSSMVVPKLPSKKKLERARKEREYEKKMFRLIKDVVLYFLFLILISFIAWGTKSQKPFFMNREIHQLFDGRSGRNETLTVNDGFKVWQWLEEIAADKLFYSQRYDGGKTTLRDRGFLMDQYSYKVGSTRLRQVRVKPASCPLIEIMKDAIIECNEQYSIINEDDRNYTEEWYLEPSNHTCGEDCTDVEMAFKYHSIFELKGLPYWGVRATYNGGGYVAELPMSQSKMKKFLAELKQVSWIDYYTRAVFLEFTVYNPNVNLFAYVNYLMEFPATGGVLPSPRIISFQIYSGVDTMGKVVLAAEIFYVMILIYFIVREAIKIKNDGKKYLHNVWNVYEMCLIIISVVAVSMFSLKQAFGSRVINQLESDKTAFANYIHLATYDEIYGYVVAAIVFMANLKFLKILSFNKHIVQLAATLKHVKWSLLYFGFFFMIIFSAYAQSCNLIFGKFLYSFHTMLHTFESLYSMLLGKFEFDNLYQSEKQLGPLFFVSFVVLVYFMMVNLMLGIIGTAYFEIRTSNILSEDAELQVFRFMITKIKRFVGLEKPQKDVGFGYVNSFDALDNRLATLDKMVTKEYRHILDKQKAKKYKQELTEEEQEALEKKKAEKKKKKKEFSLRRFFKDKLGGGNDGGMFDFM